MQTPPASIKHPAVSPDFRLTMPFKPGKVNRRRFLRTATKSTLLAAAGAGLYAWRIEPHWIEVIHRQLPIADLPAAWQGKRLVQISDLHVGPVVSHSYLRSALQRTSALEPDLVVVTGDWMTCRGHEQVEATLAVLEDLTVAAPVVGILGNHDYGHDFRNYLAADRLTDALRKRGIHLLRNQHVELDGLQIGGVDDLWCGRCRPLTTLGDLDTDKPAIMLCHNPDAVDLPAWQDYHGWILAGHTHGGQCRLPGVGAPVIPINNRRYIAGEINLGAGKRLYVNRALGYKHRVRFLTRPEITVFHMERV